MKSKFLFLLAIAAGSLNVSAQNLVPNGSFEEVVNCPEFSSNLDSECPHWYTSLISDDGIVSSPEWFHTCSEVDVMTPPNTGFGNQPPFDGEGYAGLAGIRLSTPNFREVIAVELEQTLEIGASYLIEFKAANMYFPEFAIASNRLGFNFSTHEFYDNSSFPINTSHYSHTEIMPVSNEWLTISHVFVADSAYQFLHLGNFYEDGETDFQADFPNSNSSYYAIDDVSVTVALNTSNPGIDRNVVQLFPNPANDILNIKMPQEIEINQLHILDSKGRTMVSDKSNRNSNRAISISALQSGIYFIKIETSKTLYHEAFIKI
ncbi:MAG: T9SS type A sorting domain-containing protein [Cryomorphaceae bacterium]